MNIVGNGGLAKQIKDVVDSFNSYSITFGGRIRAWTTDTFEDTSMAYIIGFAGLNDMHYRQEMFESLVNQDRTIGSVISPKATVSPDVAAFSAGSVVLHDAFVGPGAEIGQNVLIATRAIVEHDSVVESHSVVLTGAIINGNCHIGKRCMIGSGAIILQNVTIADDVIIGAGAVVTDSITESGTYVGVPARKVK